MKKKMIITMFALLLMAVSILSTTATGEAKAAEALTFEVPAIMAVDPSDNQQAQDEYNDMVKQVLYIINNYVVRSITIVATVISLIFGIINFVRFTKASEEEARQKAKKNLIGWGLGTIGAFACVWLLPIFFNFLISLMPGNPIKP